MYIEPKGFGDKNPLFPGKIGRVTFSESGKTIYYKEQTFSPKKGKRGYYLEDGTGETYWICTPKRNGTDRKDPGVIEIDDDVREEYWIDIRKRPESAHRVVFRSFGPGPKPTD